MDDLKQRWGALSPRLRTLLVIGVPVLVYLLVNAIGGSDGPVREKAPVGIIAIGVIYGTVTALGAMGIILIYRANRFINFAHGALGSMVGVIAIGLVLQHGLSYWIALPGAVIVGALMGALIEFAIIRRFQNATRLVLTVASIGLAQLLGALELFGARKIEFLALTGGFNAPLNINYRLDVKTVSGDEMLIIAIVPAVIAGLAWFLLRTNAGMAVRASAENVDRALLLGIPVRRLSTLVWFIAGGLAALTYMLQAPFAGVKPGIAGNGPTVLLPLLAAAVIARMESLPLAFGAGIGLGIMEQIVRWNTPDKPGTVYVGYLIIIVAALLLQRGKLSRGKESAGSSWSATGIIKPVPIELRRFPEVVWPKVILLALVVAAVVFVPRTWGSASQLLACYAVVWAMIGVSLVVLTGWGGNISLGQFGIAGMSGMVAANLIVNNNLDFFVVVLVSGVIGAGVALIVGVPALRIRGLFLAVTTLAFAIALDSYFLNQNTFPQFIQTSIKRPLLWERFDLEDNYTMYIVCMAFLALSILAAVGVRKARNGRVLIATRDNQRAADSASVPTTNIKLSGFLLAGTIAGIAGCLYAVSLRGLGVGSFDPVDSITVFCTAVIGGLGSLTGAVVGVLLFKFLETAIHGDLRLALNGAGLLFVLFALPGGLGQLLFGLRDRALRIIANRRGILVPSLVADKRADGKEHAENEVGLLQGALSGAPVGVGR